MDHGDHNPPWWTRRVQDYSGPRTDGFLIPGLGGGRSWLLGGWGVRHLFGGPGVQQAAGQVERLGAEIRCNTS